MGTVIGLLAGKILDVLVELIVTRLWGKFLKKHWDKHTTKLKKVPVETDAQEGRR